MNEVHVDIRPAIHVVCRVLFLAKATAIPRHAAKRTLQQNFRAMLQTHRIHAGGRGLFGVSPGAAASSRR